MSAAKNIRTTVHSWSERTSVVAFVLLFPGYMVYHFGVATAVWPPLLGGYFGIVAAVLFIILAGFGILELARRGLSVYEWVVVLFIGHCVFWILIHWALADGYAGSIQQALRNAAYLPLLAALYLSARFFPSTGIGDRRIFALALMLMAILLVGQVDADFVIGIIRSAGESNLETSTYQGYARSVVVIAILLIAGSRGLPAVVTIGLTAGMLFFIGARSEFAGFLLIVALMLPYWFRVNRWLAAAVVLACPVGFFAIMNTAASLDVFRITELLDLERSTSFQGRKELSGAALDSVLGSPLLGDYGSDRFGYAHNALGAWVSFGIVGFVLYIGLVLVAAIDSFTRLMSSAGKAPPLLVLSYCFNMYSVIMISAAKHVSDPVIALGWGFYAAHIAMESVQRSKAGLPFLRAGVARQ